jgi:hypothetical protein
MTRTIDSAKLDIAPSSIYYLPDFITPAEEQTLIDKVLAHGRTFISHLSTKTQALKLMDTHILYQIGPRCTKAQMGAPQEQKVSWVLLTPW